MSYEANSYNSLAIAVRDKHYRNYQYTYTISQPCLKHFYVTFHIQRLEALKVCSNPIHFFMRYSHVQEQQHKHIDSSCVNPTLDLYLIMHKSHKYVQGRTRPPREYVCLQATSILDTSKQLLRNQHDSYRSLGPSTPFYNPCKINQTI